MNNTSTRDVLRPLPPGLKGRLSNTIMVWVLGTLVPLGLRVLRWLPWNPRFGKIVVASRYDEVREAFLNDSAFRVPYGEKLDVIMGGRPFMLGMDDTPDYRRDTDAMRKVIRREDIPDRLAPHVETLGEKIVAEAGGELDVVDSLVRRITFEVYQDYFGIPDPPGEDLRLWATRLFEFQFADGGNDPALRRDVDMMAPALRRHIQNLMDTRRSSGLERDDVLGRCLVMQKQGEPGFTDDLIRTSVMGFIVGGPPQPPMVVPQAMEQLLRRPDALARAQEAARANDDKLLAGYVIEAMRFDPLAAFLQRRATRDSTIAAGTRRAVTVPEGAQLFVAFSSAMMDERRLPNPKSFNPRRLPHEYIHFGYGLHQCFGIHMNLALLHLMLKALLKRQNIKRAPGAAGHLSKRGIFSERLRVRYD